MLWLADSRNRLEKQRLIVAYEKRLANMERASARELRTVEGRAREEAATHRQLLERIANDVAAQRTTFMTDFQECVEKMRTNRETPRTTAPRPKERSLEGLGSIQKCLKDIRNSLTGKTGTGGEIEREELIAEIRKLRTDLKDTTCKTVDLGERVQMAASTWEENRGCRRKTSEPPTGSEHRDINGQDSRNRRSS